MNKGTEPLVYGLLAELQRCRNGSCTPTGQLASSIDPTKFGGLYALGEDIPVETLGLGANPGEAGPVQRVRLPPLKPGQYRIKQAGATSDFEVAEDAPAPEHWPAGPVLNAWPELLAPGTGSTTAQAYLDTGSIDDLMAIEASLGPPILQRRTQDGWASLPADSVSSTPASDGAAIQSTVNALTPGAYRILRNAKDGSTYTGLFWVTSLLSG